MKTKHSVEKLVLGIVQKTLSITLLVIIASTHIMVPTANAGFWGWVADRIVGTEASATEPMSEHQLADYLIAEGRTTAAPTDEHATIAGSALLSYSSVAYKPAAGTYRQTMTLQVSAYNSEVAQTDDSPFITAMGTHVRDGIVATNILPFGTLVKMPDLFGDKVFVVEDRMNSRYQNHMDIWMEDKQDALKFGRRTVAVVAVR
jgi:3D (Asp-Asp-Asp) domain-containing protein